jgi:acyl-homoserine-lactone acylase
MPIALRTPQRAARLALLALLVPLLVLLAPGGVVQAPAAGADEELTAEIRRTAHGIPHITADSIAGIGYGYGYAFAQDNICQIADSYVTVNAERSRWFGPDASWQFSGNGVSHNNLDSDFFFAQVNESGVIEELLAQAPPNGPLPEAREGVRGYVAGYNRFLEDVGGADGISDPRCKGAGWVRPITELDAYRRFYQLALLASSGLVFDSIGSAQPPAPSLPLPIGERQAEEQVATALEQLRSGAVDLNETLGGIGSNAWGIGGDGTRNGRGMLLGNPHFPWQGAERFYQAHLTIPGELDVAGASLFGVPLILIGHTETMAWSHTVSTSRRFTPFELTLVPGSPTTYLVDGQPRQMTSRELTVEVRQADGSIAEVTRTLYSSEHGPIFTELQGLPLFPWSPLKAYAFADANAANFRYLNHFFEKNHARTVREVHEINRRYQGIPWVNTIAADSTGEAYYADMGTVPNVPDSKVQTCNTSAQGLALFQLARIPVLDGARSSCEWDVDPDAVQPGTFAPDDQPFLFRRDHVSNANDSHWLTHPEQPLEGYAEIIGDERTQRSLRTRLTILMADERVKGTDDLGEPGFTVDLMTEMALNNRVHGAEVVGDELIAMCREQEDLTGSEACDVLEAWDRRANLDSQGTHLFRAFFNRASGNPGFWRDSFDPDRPVATPNEMHTANPQTRSALRDAINQFTSAGIPLDAPFGDLQWEPRGNDRIPIHGSTHGEGAFNVITPAAFDAQAGGWPRILHGTSFIQAVGFDGSPCPDVRTFVTYSQSTDPTSPWFADQTQRFSAKDWVRPPFCRDAVEEQTLDRIVVTEPADGAGRAIGRIFGSGRVETAAAVSRARFGTGRTATVVLARAGDYPDALAGAPLAAALEAPLLLTNGDRLAPAAREEARRLGAVRAVLLGGEAALSPQVVADLRAAGITQVERVSGPNRFATAAAIARRLHGLPDAASGVAFLAEGANPDPARGWPDALSAAPYAAFTGAPVLLATRDRLPAETAAVLDELDVSETIVVGGAGAVSDAVVTSIDGHGPRRLAGSTRYGTSAAVWREAVAEGMDDDHVWLATGRNFPDALAAGPAVAGLGASFLLVDSANLGNSAPTREILAEAKPSRVRILGGTSAVSAAVETQLRLLLR